MGNLVNRMSITEELIYNRGERLIPGVTHDEKESRRHLASYSFFRDLINADVRKRSLCPIITDLGCGVGFGCKVLSELNGSVVTGIDVSSETIDYAMKNYFAPNIIYKKEDLNKFVLEMNSCDYVVSRGVFEHIEDGIELARKVRFKIMFVFDVPYDEKPGNPYHKILGITEDSFRDFDFVEFYYEDLDGNITKEKKGKPNMIMCVCRKLVRTGYDQQ